MRHFVAVTTVLGTRLMFVCRPALAEHAMVITNAEDRAVNVVIQWTRNAPRRTNVRNCVILIRYVVLEPTVAGRRDSIPKYALQAALVKRVTSTAIVAHQVNAVPQEGNVRSRVQMDFLHGWWLS